MSSSLTNIGSLYHSKGQYDSALFFLYKSLSLKKEINNTISLAPVMIDIAEVQMKTGEIKNAKRNFTDALKLAYELNAYEWRLLSLNGLARVSKLQNDPANAYAFLSEYTRLKDSVFTVESSNKIIELNTRYETEKKEAEITSLTQQQQINLLQLQEEKLTMQQRNYLLASSCALILMLICSGYFYNSKQKIKALRSRELAIIQTEENERLRMAKDIHDDLGSGLSKIKFLSELMITKAGNNPEIESNLKSISSTSVNLVENMRDLIWALNPDNTTLENLIIRIREYSGDYLADFPIELSSNISENIPEIEITKEAHKNIFFIVKECLQNIIKHANCTKIILGIQLEDTDLALTICDNGRGMEAIVEKGNGLKNIKQRAGIIGASVIFKSAKGLEMQLRVPVKRITKI